LSAHVSADLHAPTHYLYRADNAISVFSKGTFPEVRRYHSRSPICTAAQPMSTSAHQRHQTPPITSRNAAVLTLHTTGLRPHRLRELRRRCRGGWQARRTSALGYCWPGRLRPPQTSILPRLTCHPHLLRCRLAGFVGQRPGEGKPPAHVLMVPLHHV
jgi:hypothetical protein